MFVFSVKTNRRQLISLLICLLLLIAVVLLSVFLPQKGASAGVMLTDEAQRLSYLRRLGYEAQAGAGVQEVLLPEEPDEALQTYNALQQQAGFDLTPYLGKRLKCWTYTVTNLPEGDAVVHLYTFRDKPVAGDVSAPDGTRMEALTALGKDEDPYGEIG